MPRLSFHRVAPRALLVATAAAAVPLAGAAVPGKMVEPASLQCASVGQAVAVTQAIGSKSPMLTPAIACGATMLSNADTRQTDGQAPLRAWSAAKVPVALPAVL